MRSCLAVSLVAVLGCGGAPAPAPRSPTAASPDASVAQGAPDAALDAARPTDASASSDEAATPAPPDAEVSPDADASVTASDASAPADAGGACVIVDFGLDLRALPSPPSTSSINMFVWGQADEVRELAPRSADVEMRHFPGAGIMYAIFRARSERAAMDACTRTTRAYLAQAPRLPIIMEPAASVTTPCRPCE